mgnify:CR=1 FL=1
MIGQTLNDCFLYFDYNKIKFISANEFNGTICDVFSTFIAYDGIKGSFFRNPEKLIDTIAALIEKAEHGLEFHIHECSIILPQCFFRTRHNVETLDFPEKKIVNKFDVDNVLEKSLVDVEDCVVSEFIPIVYKTAEDYIDNPLGQEADKLEAITSTVGVLYRIKEFFDDVVCIFLFDPPRALFFVNDKNISGGLDSRLFEYLLFCSDGYVIGKLHGNVFYREHLPEGNN